MDDSPQRFAGGPVPQTRTRAWVMLTFSVLGLAFLIWAIVMGGSADGGASRIGQFAVALAVVVFVAWRAVIGLRHNRR
jgi:MFS-type transporter involved in bile tolerance (Atg22 family)